MRRRWAAVVAAAMVVAVGGCGGGGGDGGDEPVTLRFAYWGNNDRAVVTDEAIALFEQRNPGIRVEASIAAFEGYFQRLATEVAGGNAPDVLQMDYRYIREYADRGVLLDLNEQPELRTDGIAAGLLSSGEIDGARYALPMGQNTQAFVYNPTTWAESGVAPELGWTWDQLLAGSQAVNTTPGGAEYGTADFGLIEDWFEVWLRQQGKELYTADGQLGYTQDDLVAYWELAGRFRAADATTPPESAVGFDGSVATSTLASGQAASEFGYDSATSSLTQAVGAPVALAPFPTAGEGLGQYAKPSMLASVAANSEHPAEAARLIDFLVNDPEAGAILGTTRGMPANDEVRDVVGAELTGDAATVFAFEESVAEELDPAPTPPPPGSGANKRSFQRVYEEIAFGRLTPRDGAAQFFAESERNLE